MLRHDKIWTIAGDGQMHERRVLPGVYFYRRYTTQKWSPLMHECERERGIRIGHRRFGMTETVKRFFDGKEPAIIRGAY